MRSLGISFSAHKFGNFHTFWRTYFLFVKYIRQTKVSSIPSCRKEQERAGGQCGNVVTQKGACVAPETVEACVFVKSNLGLFGLSN